MFQVDSTVCVKDDTPKWESSKTQLRPIVHRQSWGGVDVSVQGVRGLPFTLVLGVAQAVDAPTTQH